MSEYYVPPLTLQEAILEAADSSEVDNYINIQESPVVISDQVDIHAGFDSGRQLTFRPSPTMRDPARAVIASVDVGDNGSYHPIFSVAGVGHVTFQDLDIVRNITNTHHLLRLDRCTDLTIERCRIGSIWPQPGLPDCNILYINEPVRVIVRNSIFFAYCLHTFDCGIWAELGSGQACSLLLYNNVVADYKDWGIWVFGPQGDAFLLLRNNVVANHPDAGVEGVAYFSAVDERMAVESNFNAAFASVGQVEELANADCQSIAGEEGFLRRARGRVAAAFVEHTWIVDPEWDPNVDFFRLVRGGPLHSESADAGINVGMGEPHDHDVAVTDDIEGDVRPAGIPLHTDRGADQIRKDDTFLDLD
jgi:hypothetical protein